MGDVNQRRYLKRYLKTTAGATTGDAGGEELPSGTVVDGAILEVGSKDYGSTVSFRDQYPDNVYIGLDMEEGPGVDIVQDLTQGIGSLPEGEFGLIICCSVMEHVKKPWVMAENMTRLLKPGGAIYVSVPWVWRYHAYPDDYFRFSWKGVEALFPDLQWASPCYSTNVPGEIVKINDATRHFDDHMAEHARTPKGSRTYLPYLMVNMIGTKPLTRADETKEDRREWLTRSPEVLDEECV